MPRFGKACRFKHKDELVIVTKDFASMGLIHKELRGPCFSPGFKPLDRSSFLKSNVKDGCALATRPRANLPMAARGLILAELWRGWARG